MPPPFRRRTTKKEPRRSPRSAVTLDERIEEIMDRVQQAGDNQVERVDDAVRAVNDAIRSGYAEGAEMLCELAEKLMRSGYEPQARLLWQQARAGYPDDVWIYVQAGIEYGDIGNHARALEWQTTGLELAFRTGDPESALEQLRPLRASCLSALGRPSDEIQQRAAQGERGDAGER
jgi:tetratricopeptide (TPR) repeat protein